MIIRAAQFCTFYSFSERPLLTISPHCSAVIEVRLYTSVINSEEGFTRNKVSDVLIIALMPDTIFLENIRIIMVIPIQVLVNFLHKEFRN